ncbi:hypothetical protein DFJ58DRAFT_735524 [Suillus subalutaceus]|uniref:uncharacterized protein n=1 Tax=Suillus subalutaceus TaxID=48586 RepID=UPI001B878B40|nr:uncharacterized protein DFJ58DRAFT_735524 [Suillus subalutaceus]KAG1835413.1 hypothetical protein DFJ58DRAFT_735524 [Suillus subalutaceus]
MSADGTSNKYGDKNTNIVELYSEMVKDREQLTYYNSGVGTYAKGHTHWMKQVSSVFDLAFAFNISQTIMDAYRWVSDTYQPGDKIFLFGFSRGAYQVRALAGMIHEMGLILPGNIEQIPYAFELYSAINSGKLKDKLLAQGFRSTFSRQGVVIHFIGVWDTVSSVGIRKEKILPSTDTCDHICYFRQGLALDERRVKFLPEYVYGGMSDRPKSQFVSPPKDEYGLNEDLAKYYIKDQVKEVWFAGSHSDVGGGKREKTNALNFQDMPLLWMREEALEAGLLLHPPKVAFKYEDLEAPKTNDSLTFRWWLLELLPIRRLCYNNSDQHTSLPHVGKGRIISPGQKVHASVLLRPNYRSKASFWRNLQQWPEAIYFHVGNDEHERLRSAQGPLAQTQAWEVPFKRSTAKALVGTIHKKHMLDYVDRLAFMCSFKLGVEAVREVNPLETLEAILGIHGKSTANIEYAAEDEGISFPADSKETTNNDTAEEKHDLEVRLSAVVAYCGLGMSCLSIAPLTNSQKRTVEKKDDITESILANLDVPALLKDKKLVRQGRACAALPALCEVKALRKKLLNDDLIHRIIELCQTAGENRLIAMKTLSYLAQRFGETSDILSRRSDFIKEILAILKDKSATVVVAALKILAAVISKENIPKAKDILSEIRQIEIVKMLKRLIRRRDFFVTPAAVAALCEICKNGSSTLLILVINADTLPNIDELRAEAIRNDILVTLIDLFEFDKQGLSGGPRGLMTLAESEDVRTKLASGSHIGKLVAFSRDKVVEKSKEATEELTQLSKHDVLRKQIIDSGGLDSIVDNLAKPDHALFAADALVTLMKYDDAKERILGTKVDLYLLQMIEGRIFDGTVGREGIDILAEIFKNDDLRSMMLNPKNPPSLDNGSWNFSGKDARQRLLKNATNYVWEKTIHRLVKKPAMDDSERPKYPTNIIGILHKMIETTRNSAINYLRIIADHEDACQAMVGVGIIEPLLWCLKATDVDILALNDILEKIARHESLRGEIIKNDTILAEMLSSHYPVEALRMTATLESLSSHGEIRQKVQGMDEYKDLKKDALHYLDPHHHPHDHDLYTSASQAIKSIIGVFDAYDRTTHQTDPPHSYLDPYDYPYEIYQYMI